MAFWDAFRRSGDVDDRRPGKPASEPRKPVAKAKKAGLAAAFLMALGLGWCGHEASIPEGPKVEIDGVTDFVSAIMGDLEDTWQGLLGDRYRSPGLVLYTRSTGTKGCGRATAAQGPFYCPDDQRIYLDFSFFAELKTKACRQAGDPCEFARAYVIAHEFGHAVQDMLGTFAKFDAEHEEPGPDSVPVRIELQADCFAGVWAGRSGGKWKNITPEMVTAAWQAAQFGGDDHFGAPLSEWAHGSGAQRAKWFLKGHDGKTVASCDTFAGKP